ncbi:MAG TPA: fibronectin type III domain-containing protein [Armatimonadota bacterium]|jgi:hypothetical protein
MLQRFFHRLGTLAVLLPLAALAAHAAVSVTEVSVTGTGAPYDISYVLNTNATAGTIDILNSGNTVVKTITLASGALSQGIHFVTWDGKGSGGVLAPAGQYTARISATAGAVAAGGQLLWGPYTISTGTNVPVWYHMTVNKNPASPYYGRVYVADYANDRVLGYSSDGTLEVNINTVSRPLNEFSSGTRDVQVGKDDRLYIYHEDNPAPGTGICSVKQDGTDYREEFATDIYPQQMAMTDNGTAKRFYFSMGYATSLTGAGVRYQTSADTTTTVLLADPSGAAGGSCNGIAVLDSYNDPVGHANSVTIFVRTNSASTGSPGLSTVVRWDGDNADPLNVFSWTKTWTSTALPGIGYTGTGVEIGPDGNVWTSLSNADSSVRGYYKLDKATGALLARINPVPEKPRNLAVDAKGNVAAALLPNAENSVRGRDVAMFAPEDSGSTDTITSGAFAGSGAIATPVKITAGPTVVAASTSATIGWTTDVNSSTALLYGNSPTALINRVSGTNGVTAHSVAISGLTTGNTYYYQVRSAASGYSTAYSDVLAFVAKNPAPVISSLAVTATQTTASITWNTDKATDSAVSYGTSPNALTQNAAGTANTLSHSVFISGLTPGTTYYFVAQSGSATIATATTPESFFATLTAGGLKVRTLSAFGDFQYGWMDDVFLAANGVTLNKKAAPNGVDDAGVPDLPLPRHNNAVCAYGGYLYCLGGRGASTSNTVFFAPINADGTVGAWQQTTPLTDERYFTMHAAFGYNGYIYVVAGAAIDASEVFATQTTTLFAAQNPLDGTLGPWSVAGTFSGPTPPERAYGAVGVYNGRVYYVGGRDTASVIYPTIYEADIKPDGTFAPWTVAANSLPAVAMQQGLTIHNGRIYDWGGTSDGTTYNTDQQISVIGAGGEPGPWAASGNPPLEGRFAFAGGITHGYALEIGGSLIAARTDRISAAEIMADQSFGDFTDVTATYSTGNPLRDMDGAAWQDRYYVAGGRSSDTINPTVNPSANTLAAAITFAPSSTYVANGRYESPIIDLGVAEALQSLAVTATGSGVTLSIRTAGANGTFGTWAAASGLSQTFTGVTARYVQFALALSSTGATAPTVTSVALTYGTASVPFTTDDVKKALRIAAGLDSAVAADMARLDIVTGNGTTGADGLITVTDATAIDRRINGK